MGSRRQFTDCYLDVWTAEVDANAVKDGTANAASCDTVDCNSVGVSVRVRALANNKKLTFKLQESSDNAAWVDVPKGAKSDLDPAAEVDANGNHKYFYAGQSRYVRLVVTSVEAAPEAKLDVIYRKDNLFYKPENEGI